MLLKHLLQIRIVVLSAILFLLPAVAYAHNVSKRDAAYVRSNTGAAIGPFLYLGAKHMVTGYDHLLFLVGVIFLPKTGLVTNIVSFNVGVEIGQMLALTAVSSR